MKDIDEWLKGMRSTEKTIIVEGPKDRDALEYFGIKNIVMLSRKPLFEIIEDVAASSREAIILTDFDRKGRELYGKLSSGLQRLGVEVDNKFREYLQRTRLSHVQGLVGFVSNNN